MVPTINCLGVPIYHITPFLCLAKFKPGHKRGWRDAPKIKREQVGDDRHFSPFVVLRCCCPRYHQSMTMTPQKEEETALESTQESVEKASTPKETPTAEESEETHNGRDEENSKQPAVPHMPSYSSGVSFSSPPVINQSYPYYGPPYSAARTFNRSNHAMMATIKTFPEKLHQILDVAAQTGLADVISFFPHGRSFKVHKVSAERITDYCCCYCRRCRASHYCLPLNSHHHQKQQQRVLCVKHVCI